MPNKTIDLRRVTLASHLILTGYGHWAPNDIRGSGSSGVRVDKLKQLAPIHFGRKRVQPSKSELRAFHKRLEPLLEHTVLWFDPEMRRVIARAIEMVARQRGYTIWACAILRNHLHLIVRTHRDKSDEMLAFFADAIRTSLRDAKLVPMDHPVWANRPYKRFITSIDSLWTRIRYIEENPGKEGLDAQRYAFVVPCLLR